MLKVLGLENYGLFEMLGLIMVIIIGEYFLIDYLSPNLFPDLRKKWERWRRKKRLLKNAIFTTSKVILDYAKKNNPSLISKWGGGSHNPDYEKVRSELYIRGVVRTSIFPKINEWQDFFDQVLKMRAEYLQKVYDRESDFRKKDLKNTAPGFLSRTQIDTLLYLEKSLMEVKEEAERDFWDLHDTLQYLGLETWDSYKMYLRLKPDHTFPIFDQ